MASYVKIESFVEQMAEQGHDLGGDQLEVVLTTNANAPVATDDVLGDLTEISYTNCSTRNITTSTSAETSGTYKLVLTDLVLTASGGTVGPFQWVIINNTSGDLLICYFDYGSEITLADGETLTIDFDAANGLLQIA